MKQFIPKFTITNRMTSAITQIGLQLLVLQS